MANKDDNPKLAIYNALRSVPKEAQKPFNNGRMKGTDVNPMWRIKALTEQFGACGDGFEWNIKEWREKEIKDTIVIICVVELTYTKPDGTMSAPVVGVGGNTLAQPSKNGYYINDDAYKMAYTDAQSNAAKQIGCAADIWYEKDCDYTKYTQPIYQPVQTVTQRPVDRRLAQPVQPAPAAQPVAQPAQPAPQQAQPNHDELVSKVVAAFDFHTTHKLEQIYRNWVSETLKKDGDIDVCDWSDETLRAVLNAMYKQKYIDPTGKPQIYLPAQTPKA